MATSALRPNLKRFDRDNHNRRSTMITGLVDLSLLSTSFILLKDVTDRKDELAKNYVLLLTALSAQIIAEIALILMLSLTFAPNMEQSQVMEGGEKDLSMPKKMRELKKREQKRANRRGKRVHNDEFLDLFPDSDKEFYDAMTAEFKRKYKDNIEDKTEEEVRIEMKTLAMEDEKRAKVIKRREKRKRVANRVNNIVTGLTVIILILKVLFESFYDKKK